MWCYSDFALMNDLICLQTRFLCLRSDISRRRSGEVLSIDTYFKELKLQEYVILFSIVCSNDI